MDARLDTGFPRHLKTRRILKRLGKDGGWSLVCLWLWAAEFRPDGNLRGVSAEELEMAADWNGEPGAFLGALAEVGYLDGEEGSWSLHDWSRRNPWVAGQPMRSAKARWNAVKRHHGEKEADRLVPEWALHLRGLERGDDAASYATSIDPVKKHAVSNAPSPSPTALTATDPNADVHEAFEGQAIPADLAARIALGTIAGRACRIMREAGCLNTNPSHPDLLAALAEGISPETLGHAAREAKEAGKHKPFAYAIATARSRHAEGAKKITEGGAVNGTSAGGSSRGAVSAVDRVARNIARARAERGEGAAGWIEGEATGGAD